MLSHVMYELYVCTNTGGHVCDSAGAGVRYSLPFGPINLPTRMEQKARPSARHGVEDGDANGDGHSGDRPIDLAV